jgi:uncharacterized membrane protein
MRGRTWGLCALCIAVAVATASAKGSGGRMGGSSWGKPSSSSSSSSHSSSSSSYHPSSSSSSSSYRPSTSYTSSSTHYTPSIGYTTTPVSYTSSDPSPYTSYSTSSDSTTSGPGIGVILLIAFAVLVLIGAAVLFLRTRDDSQYLGPFVSSDPVDAVDVSVLRIAIDGRARKFVQAELARIAKIADTATEDGRLAMLREVALLLRRVRDAWVYGGAVNEPMRSQNAAKAVFDGHVDDARVRFTNETVSNVQGVKSGTKSDDYVPHSDEGEGVILVSIIVAARSELFTVAHIADGEDIRKALEAASHRSADDLVAIEIVWMPSEADDRMSSVELEAKYPRPDLIPIAGALVGKTFCDYCGGPFPAELVSCPHCGAPTAGHPHAEPKAA